MKVNRFTAPMDYAAADGVDGLGLVEDFDDDGDEDREVDGMSINSQKVEQSKKNTLVAYHASSKRK